tara:strand:- start:4767 stop:5603 length:837 start_codon:yes stop_codon:yes gene_type:complete
MSEEAAAPEGQAESAPEGQATQSSWIDSVESTETKSWAESKGLQNGTVENVLGSYRNLEQLMGADKAGRTVTLLGDDASDSDRNEFYTKLGRPEDADAYGIPVPEGDDGDFANWAGRTFHDAGLTQKQADHITAQWAEYGEARGQAAQDVETISAVDAETDLRKEWGAAFDQKVNGINAAASQLGLSDANLEGLRATMGPVEAMKFVDKLSSQLGDDAVITGESHLSGVMTPATAQEEMMNLNGNKEFMDAWLDKQHPGHAAAVAKKTRLARFMVGES